jgi:hypothetical protein
MLEILAPTVLAASFIAICLSAVSLLIHWRDHRAPTPASLTAEVQALRIAQADVVDRLEHWTRRDRVRRLRDRNSDEGSKARGGDSDNAAGGDELGISAPGDGGGANDGGLGAIAQLQPGSREKIALRKLARSRGLIR